MPGRFEPVDEGQPFTVLVDYAHTPDALDERPAHGARRSPRAACSACSARAATATARSAADGPVAAELADVAIVTSDNPRSEDPQAIVDEVLAGAGREVEVEPDRRAAIARALERRGPATSS